MNTPTFTNIVEAIEQDRPSVTEFFFYLDAWSYCTHHAISLAQIKRKDWKTWHLVDPQQK
jgi:hypothetical protein